MTAPETSLFESGQRVGLAVADFQAGLMDDFAPLRAANAARAALVAAIVEKTGVQGTDTTGATLGVGQAREELARRTDTLSLRAQAYALAAGRPELVQAFALTYSEVRFGEAAPDVARVRALVARVQALPARVRAEYRLTAAVIEAPALAADAFELAVAAQAAAEAAPRLASLQLPELLRRLRAELRLMAVLIGGQRTDPDARWEQLYLAFTAANKRRTVAPKFRPDTSRPRIVRTVRVGLKAGETARLSGTNFGPAYTLTVENHGAAPLRLWMAQRGGALTTPGICPPGEVTVLTRAAIGPETARFLTARFEGNAGGEAVVVIRKVVGE